MAIITDEFIRAFETPSGGFTASSLAALGVAWPPQKGWKRELIGSELPDGEYQDLWAVAQGGKQFCLSCRKVLAWENFGTKKQSGKIKQCCLSCCKSNSSRVKKAARERPAKIFGGESYSSRNRILAELGFASYSVYLRSDLWKQIRAKVYQHKGKKCHLCPSQATELHHNRYHKNDLTGKCLRFIFPVCHACHEKIEFKGEEKSTVRQAAKAFKRICKKKKP